MSNVLYNNFTAGEVSPKLGGRYDLAIYKSGVSKLENFLPMLQGGLIRRPGTKSIGIAAGVRLVPFVLSVDAAYIVELGDCFLRLWYNGSLVSFVREGRTVTQTETPYVAGDISGIQVTQDATSLYLVHRNYPPMRLQANGGSFLLSEFIPTLAEKIDDGNVTEGEYDEDNADMFIKPMEYPGCVTFCSNRLWFASSYNHPYRLWASRPFEPTDFEMYDIVEVTDETQTAEQYMLSVQYGGKEAWKLTVEGTASADGALAISLRGISVSVPYVSGNTAKEIAVLVSEQTFSGWTVTVSDNVVTFVAEDTGTKTGETGVTVSDLTAAMTLIIAGYADGDEPTTTVTINRKVYRADNAMMLEVGSDRNDRIEWIVAKNNILVGTASGEWIMSGNIDALNQSIAMQSAYGSAPVQAQAALTDLFFIQSGGKRLRAYCYSSDGYSCMDLTYSADHILRPGVVEMHWQRVPEPRLYCVLKDGTLAVLSYDRLYGMQAWARWTFDGKAMSLCILDTSAGQDVYILVVRDGISYIEMFDEESQVFSDRHDTETPVAFTSGFTANRFETSTDRGSTIGKVKRITKVTARLLNSGRFKVGYNGNEETKTAVEDGDISLYVGGGYEKELKLSVSSVDDEPLTILAMAVETGVA